MTWPATWCRESTACACLAGPTSTPPATACPTYTRRSSASATSTTRSTSRWRRRRSRRGSRCSRSAEGTRSSTWHSGVRCTSTSATSSARTRPQRTSSSTTTSTSSLAARRPRRWARRDPLGHCVHHQAIDRLGRGLVVTARRGDVIEGVELPDQWVVGVQWHPEDDAAVDAQQQALFDGFVAAARGEVGARRDPRDGPRRPHHARRRSAPASADVSSGCSRAASASPCSSPATSASRPGTCCTTASASGPGCRSAPRSSWSAWRCSWSGSRCACDRASARCSTPSRSAWSSTWSSPISRNPTTCRSGWR